jgi:multisubunit Na+/H+ antiporter MnhB subunit
MIEAVALTLAYAAIGVLAARRQFRKSLDEEEATLAALLWPMVLFMASLSWAIHYKNGRN